MKELGYADISLKPQKCIVDNRSECDTSVKFGNHIFAMPVCPANMKSVVNIETCKFMAKNNWFYIMHRFGVDMVQFSKEMRKNNYIVSISVGINEDSYGILNSLLEKEIEPDFITIDVANAWSDKTEKITKWIKDKFKETFLIVGNVATSEAVKEIQKWGASSIKIGISNGKVCLTRNKTGINRPSVSAILDCASVANIPLIADGGIVQHGDISKALICGASAVMAGSLFSGYDQSAGEIIELIDEVKYKEYYGSDSKHNKEELKNIEGKKIFVKYKGDMSKLLKELKEDLQSSISYCGAKNVEGLKGKEYYII